MAGHFTSIKPLGWMSLPPSPPSARTTTERGELAVSGQAWSSPGTRCSRVMTAPEPLRSKCQSTVSLVWGCVWCDTLAFSSSKDINLLSLLSA